MEFTGHAHQVFAVMTVAWWMIFLLIFSSWVGCGWKIHTPKNSNSAAAPRLSKIAPFFVLGGTTAGDALNW